MKEMKEIAEWARRLSMVKAAASRVDSHTHSAVSTFTGKSVAEWAASGIDLKHHVATARV
jgi:hypothetical protein